jgi:hypothetical protein
LGLAESRHTTSIVGVGSGPRTISAERSKRVTTHFRIVFIWDKDYEKRLQHEDRNDPEPNFGMYTRDVAQLDIIAPVSERSWYVDCLSKHRQPLVKADLERRSETSEAWDVVSYSLFSDRRAVERAEKR